MSVPAIKMRDDRAMPAAERPTSVPRAFPGGAGAAPGTSGVAEMQRDLERRLIEPASGKWSARKTLLFVVGTCGLFWSLVITAAISNG